MGSRRDRARRFAAAVVRTHGYQFVVEDAAISAWAHTWGRGLAAFPPGPPRSGHRSGGPRRCQGGMSRVPIRTTALSQHCPAAPACKSPSPTASIAVLAAGSSATVTRSPPCSAPSSSSTGLAKSPLPTSTTVPPCGPTPTSSAFFSLPVAGGKTPGPSQPTSPRVRAPPIVDVHIGANAGGSANRRHGRGPNPG